MWSGDENTDRREANSGRDSKTGGRFGGEFRDSEEPSKRQEKEFQFDVDKPKSSVAKSSKKIDLGAAAFYKLETNPTHASVSTAFILIDQV